MIQVRVMKRVLVPVAALVIGAGLGVGGTFLFGTSGPTVDGSKITQCASDDGAGDGPCVWDATRQGDHRGTSFYSDGQGNSVSLG